MNGFWQQRSLPFVAGTAVAYGLLYDEAIRAITGTPAKILGVADKAGTLEPGKPATFIISGGDILDIRNSVVEWAFIAGEEVDLEEDYQKALYRKFRQKYIDQGTSDLKPPKYKPPQYTANDKQGQGNNDPVAGYPGCVHARYLSPTIIFPAQYLGIAPAGSERRI